MSEADLDKCVSIINGWRTASLHWHEALDLLLALDLPRNVLVGQLLLAIPLDTKD